MKNLLKLYVRISEMLSYLQSPFLLAVRLYWGWQLVMTGWGKLHNLARFTEIFANLNIPFPSASAHFIGCLEFFGGILLILGLGSRLTAFLMTCNMLVAYWTADHDAFVSFFSDPDKFSAASPYTILFASLLVLIFGAGLFSVDALLAKRCRVWLENPGSRKND
jgi:putative oxidoreductase